MKHLILFCDYGLDDAAATISVFLQAHRFDRIDLVPIGGNVPVAVAYRNCFTLLSLFENVLDKVRVVDTRHLSQPSEYLADIHGADGMGDLFQATVPVGAVTTCLFEDWLSDLKGTETVISLGPMTLVQPLMEQNEHPLVIMGGCIHTPPNFKGYEFNHCLDQEAFAYCAPKAQAVITLDTCRVPALDIRNKLLPESGLYADILRRNIEISYERKENGCYVWDDVAVAYVLYPERFTTITETDPHGNTYLHGVYGSDLPYFQET